MADEIIDPKAVAENNAAVAEKLKSQDIMGKSTATGEFGEATSALDALAAQVQPKPEPAAKGTPEAKLAEDAAAKEAAAKLAAKPAEDAAAKEAADAAAKETADHLKRAEEYFKGSPSLPPNASPKSAEAFSSIKVKAAQEISAREQKIADLQKKLDESKNPSPEVLQQQKELEDTRAWRQKLDVDFDPKFKEFDKTIEQQREFVYAQLAKNPTITPEIIAKIREHGGPDKVILSKLFASVNDPALQRLVESKVADIEMSKYNKDQAIASAKANLVKYLEERQVSLTQEKTKGQQETVSQLEGLLGKLDWFAEKKAEATADDAAKAEAAAHNKFVEELKPQLSAALQDDSPQMKAILITGMAQLFQLQRRMPALEAKLASAEKELTEVRGKWEAVKNSSRSRLQESGAPAGGLPVPKAGSDVHERAGDALDKIAKQVMEEKAAAANR